MTPGHSLRSSDTLTASAVDVVLGGVRVLHGVTLSLGPGWTAIVGPNGAGKSTLLRTFAGLQTVSAGAVTLDGTPLLPASRRERGRRIAWLAQQHADASGELTVREVVQLGRLPWLGLLGTPGPADERAVDDALAETGCTPWQHRRLDELSGGERQRALVARVLAVGASVLLLDEPTTHVDAQHQVALTRLLRRQADLGRTVVSALHDLTLAFAADRIVLMGDGRVLADSEPDDPSLHRQMIDVFGGAIRIERIGSGWAVVPNLAG